jgi:hypothetical protein
MDSPALPLLRPDLPPTLEAVAPLSPPAVALAAGAQSVSAAIGLLVENRLFMDVLAALANGLTADSAVFWAVMAAKQVAHQLPPNEIDALAAAEDMLVVGPDSAADGLAAALAGADMQGPGSWAAQAAAWAGKAADEIGDLPLPYAKAVEAAVKLAAALTATDWPLAKPDLTAPALAVSWSADALGAPATMLAEKLESETLEVSSDAASPEQQLNALLEPFVELGMQIAKGLLAPP